METKIIKQNSKNDGFTLVEALVAISILMIAIASPMTLAQKGLSTATLSKDQMIALFLAQDGLEAVKNIRDQIALRGKVNGVTDWLGDPLTPCVCDSNTDTCDFGSVSPSPKFCTIDTTASVWSSVYIKAGGSDNPGTLKISSTSGSFEKYDYVQNKPDSKFIRKINIKKNPAGNLDEAVVNVRVSWTAPQGLQHVDIQNFIYNFSENFE